MLAGQQFPWNHHVQVESPGERRLNRHPGIPHYTKLCSKHGIRSVTWPVSTPARKSTYLQPAVAIGSLFGEAVKCQHGGWGDFQNHPIPAKGSRFRSPFAGSMNFFLAGHIGTGRVNGWMRGCGVVRVTIMIHCYVHLCIELHVFQSHDNLSDRRPTASHGLSQSLRRKT